MSTQADREPNEDARAAAQAAVRDMEIQAPGRVVYHSLGRVLIHGDEQAQILAARIEPPLHAQVVMTRGEVEPGVPVVAAGGRDIWLQGHLGRFELTLGEAGRHTYEKLEADIVIDLDSPGLNTAELPPPGYYHCGDDPAEADRLLDEITNLTGTFEKPKFFEYDPGLCAHGRSGQTGCTRCIEACPADAIVSLGERVEVDPNLCQGGGICAAACPTGAMEYAYPGPMDTQERLRRMLSAYREAGGATPVVRFAAEEAANLPATPAHVLTLSMEELGSVGMDLWLSALAWGATAVVLLDGPSVPAGVRTELCAQLAITAALLTGLGYAGDAVRLVAATDPLRPVLEDRPISPHGPLNGKRERLYFALDHLAETAPQRPEHIALPQGAPFGRIRVNADACTLCMGCTSVCPAKAIRAGDETPRLIFHEANCVQCGLCAAACPEHAIDLHPCFTTDPNIRRQNVALHEEPPFHCVSCGKPFATRSVIDHMLTKLAGHPMFQSERARRRLEMCDDCRVVDAVQDPEAMNRAMNRGTGLNRPH